MGYRVRLGKVSKADHEKYKDMTAEQFASEFGDDTSPYRPLFHHQYFEIGKYVDCSEHMSEFYTSDICEGSEFKIMTKDGLKVLIDDFHKSTADYMSSMLACASSLIDDKDGEVKKCNERNGVVMSQIIAEDIKLGITTPADELFSFFYGMHQEWCRGKDYGLVPFYLDEPDEKKDGDVVRSWKIQYAILNLVFIYQMHDWENDLLIYSGW